MEIVSGLIRRGGNLTHLLTGRYFSIKRILNESLIFKNTVKDSDYRNYILKLFPVYMLIISILSGFYVSTEIICFSFSGLTCYVSNMQSFKYLRKKESSRRSLEDVAGHSISPSHFIHQRTPHSNMLKNYVCNEKEHRLADNRY